MARLIRGWGASPISPRPVLEAESRAAAILAEAEAKALAREAEASRVADDRRAAAEAEGKAEASAAAAAMLAVASAKRDRALAEAEREVITLAVAVARRVVGEAVDRDPRLVEAFAAEAIERARGSSRLRVAVSPEDAPSLRELASAQRVPIAVEPDASLARGDCVVHGDIGTVDARIGTKLSSFLEALLRELDRERR